MKVKNIILLASVLVITFNAGELVGRLKKTTIKVELK